MSKRWALSLICGAFALLLIAWVFSTPPFRAPDEPAHYLRAASIANGRLIGPKAPAAGATPQQTAYIVHDSRATLISEVMAPPGSVCPDGRPLRAAGRCLVASYEGNFEPLPYLLPALAFKTSGHATGVLWRGRLASALPCLAFILLAFALLWSESAWSLVGLFAALTPTALFVDSVINPNGMELAANLAFVAGLLRISRSPGESPRWVWAATAASGATSIVAWQLGWVFVCVQVLLFTAFGGRDAIRVLVVAHRRELRLAALTMLAAFALFLAYGLNANLLHGGFGISPLGNGLHQGLDQLRTNLFGAVSLFGLLDVALPSDLYYWIWFVLVLGLLAGGVALGSGRERLVPLLATAVALVFPVLFYAWVLRHSGFGLQPRHVMPLMALIPLLGGELIFRHREQLRPAVRAYAPSAIISLIALFQLFAWWINARTSAGDPTRVWFPSNAAWNPPGGWLIWTLAAVLGSATMIVFAASEALSGPPRESFANHSGSYEGRSAPVTPTLSAANASSSLHIDRQTRSI